MSGIPIEQPPSAIDPELSEYLDRLVINLSAAFQVSGDYEPYGQLPTKIQDGMVRFFSIAILPEIPAKGLYVVIDGVWIPIGVV